MDMDGDYSFMLFFILLLLKNEKTQSQLAKAGMNRSLSLYGNIYEGESESGIVIQMFLDSNEKIISAFPIYEGDV